MYVRHWLLVCQKVKSLNSATPGLKLIPWWNKTLYNMVNILIRFPLLQYFVMSSDLNNFPIIFYCDDHIEITWISKKWSLATLITVRLLEHFERLKKIAVVSNTAVWGLSSIQRMTNTLYTRHIGVSSCELHKNDHTKKKTDSIDLLLNMQTG